MCQLLEKHSFLWITSIGGECWSWSGPYFVIGMCTLVFRNEYKHGSLRYQLGTATYLQSICNRLSFLSCSYDEGRNQMDYGYPRSIRQDFPGIGSKVDAVFENYGEKCHWLNSFNPFHTSQEPPLVRMIIIIISSLILKEESDSFAYLLSLAES